jgi:type II secretory pathway component PulM
MTAFFSNLSVRERWLVLGAAVFVGSALLFAIIVNPLMDKKQRYIRMAQDKRQDLAEFNEFASEYRSLQSSLAEMKRKVASGSSDMSLLAAMESSARKLGLADRIASMKPFTSELESSGMVQSSVEMRVEKIDLKGLVQFIEAIETGPNMAVTTRLRIKTRFDDSALLDTTLLVTTLEAR